MSFKRLQSAKRRHVYFIHHCISYRRHDWNDIAATDSLLSAERRKALREDQHQPRPLNGCCFRRHAKLAYSFPESHASAAEFDQGFMQSGVLNSAT